MRFNGKSWRKSRKGKSKKKKRWKGKSKKKKDQTIGLMGNLEGNLERKNLKKDQTIGLMG